MAYSRWGGSDWYVFWTLGRGTDDDPYLEMWFAGTPVLRGANYSQLKDIGLEALSKLVPDAPADALPELLEYVQLFCEDVKLPEDERRW